MRIQHYKAILTGVWVLVMATVWLTVGATSVPAMAGLAAAVVLPPLLMMWLWHDPVQSLSESIHEARR